MNTFRQQEDYSRGYETEILPLTEHDKHLEKSGIMQPSYYLISHSEITQSKTVSGQRAYFLK